MRRAAWLLWAALACLACLVSATQHKSSPAGSLDLDYSEDARHGMHRKLAQATLQLQSDSQLCVPSDREGYDCMVQLLNGAILVYHSVPNAASNSVDFAVHSVGTGWVAVSWPNPLSRASMLGGTAVIGRMVNVQGSVAVYDLNNHAASGVVPTNPAGPRSFTISQASLQQGSAGTTMTFTRPLTSAYTATDLYTLQVAYHRTDNSLSFHSNDVTGFEVALSSPTSTAAGSTGAAASGEVYKAEDMRVWYIWHGMLMVVGWGVLIPIAILFARRLKDLGPVWIKVHRWFNVVGLLLATVSIIIAFVMFRVHKPAAHRVLGIASMMGGWIQALTGIFRASPPKQGGLPTYVRAIWLWCHRWLGYAALAGAIIDIFLGIDKYDTMQFNTHSKYHIAFGAWLGCLFLVGLGLELRTMLLDAEPWRSPSSLLSMEPSLTSVASATSFSNPASMSRQNHLQHVCSM